MPQVVRDTAAMVKGMSPVLRPQTYHFCHLAQGNPTITASALATFQEDEGLSVIVETAVAQEHGLPVDQPMRCITLNVYSALDGVGLTAAVASALSDDGIACNMVAAYHHDHAFVPAQQADQAIGILLALAEAAT